MTNQNPKTFAEIPAKKKRKPPAKKEDPFNIPPEDVVVPQGVCYQIEQPTEQPVEWITVVFDNGKHYRIAGKYLARRIAEIRRLESYDVLIRQPNTLISFMKLYLKWREISQFAFQYTDPKPFIEDDHLKDAKTGFILKKKPLEPAKDAQAPIVQQAQSGGESQPSGKKIKPPITAYEHPFPDFESEGDDGEVLDL